MCQSTEQLDSHVTLVIFDTLVISESCGCDNSRLDLVNTSPHWCIHVWLATAAGNDMVVKDMKRGSQPVSRPTLIDRTVWEQHRVTCKWDHLGTTFNVKVVKTRLSELCAKPCQWLRKAGFLSVWGRTHCFACGLSLNPCQGVMRRCGWKFEMSFSKPTCWS